MPRIRYDRINEEIKKALSEIVRDMKDPRISPMTTILLVEATNDLKLAKVKVSVYDKDDSVRRETVILPRSAGEEAERTEFEKENAIIRHTIMVSSAFLRFILPVSSFLFFCTI